MLRAVAFDHGNTLAEFRWDDGLWRQGVGAMLAVAGGGPGQIDPAAAGLRRRFDRPRPGRPDRARLSRGGRRGADRARPDGAPRRGAALHRGRVPPLGARAPRPPAGARAARRRARAWACAVPSSQTRSTRPACFAPTWRRRGSPSGWMPSCSRASSASAGRTRRVYAAVAAALEVEPGEVMFVGDRLREDIAGPAEAGMRTCLATWYRLDPGDRSAAGGACARTSRCAGKTRRDCRIPIAR